MQERSSDPPLNRGPFFLPRPMSMAIFLGSCPFGDPRPDPVQDPQKGPPERGGHLRGRPSPGRHALWIFSHPERVRAVLDPKGEFGAPPRALRSNGKRPGPGDLFPVGPGARLLPRKKSARKCVSRPRSKKRLLAPGGQKSEAGISARPERWRRIRRTSDAHGDPTSPGVASGRRQAGAGRGGYGFDHPSRMEHN